MSVVRHTTSERKRARRMLIALLALAWSTLGGSCGRKPGLPPVSSKQYVDAVRAFYVGVAALQVGDTRRAQVELDSAEKLAPEEPAVLADLGLMALRANQFDVAAIRLEKARALAPNDSRILLLIGILQAKRGHFSEASAGYRRVIELDPGNLRARYALVEQVQQQGGPASDIEAQRLLTEITVTSPENLVVQLELARLAAKRGDVAALRAEVAKLDAAGREWPQEQRSQLAALRGAATGADARAAATRVIFLQNVLKQLPKYRADYLALKNPEGQIGEPLVRLVKLRTPPATPALADTSLRFSLQPDRNQVAKITYACAVYLAQDAKPSILVSDSHTARITGSAISLPFPGGPSATSPSLHGVAAVDLNSDYKTDLVLAGAGGIKLYRQGANRTFADATAGAKLPPATLSEPLYGVWAADLDLDGDLDLVLAPVHGAPKALRNNGDSTFTPISPFLGVDSLRDFGWVDLDGDGTPDAVLLDATGHLHVFTNERGGHYRSRPLPTNLGTVLTFTVIDANGDGQLGIVALRPDGALVFVSDKDEGKDWTTKEIGRLPSVPAHLSPENSLLIAADVDNNGAPDIVATVGGKSYILLQDAQHHFQPLSTTAPAPILGLADFEGHGRLDGVGVTAAGQSVRLLNRGLRNYNWQDIRPRAASVRGDQRINSFGIGGEIEVRAGLLFAKLPITGPVVHFGIGDHPDVSVASIIWPHGVMQAEFSLKADTAYAANQRLTGSCPWVFAWNGKRMEFVTDFIWRSPLGLKINAQDTGSVVMTEDRVRIRGDQLVPRNGYYDIRITAELWETHFFDHISLMTVDHPAGTEMFVDERFSIPPPSLAPVYTAHVWPVAHAWDDRRTDVTETVRELDGKYLDTFGRGQYQGVTRDHYVEVDLGAEAPDKGPLWLIAQGWIHPTNSSINVAISQGSHAPPRGLSLEIPNGKGGWVTAKPALGFPEGKMKTILVDLSGLFKPGTPKRLRLRTNLEIFWDRLAWAPGLPGTPARVSRALPSEAMLSYRGFSAVSQANASSPELPDYNTIDGTEARWRDLEGYCTRFGNVKELLKAVDDRYVIMNAGDEMSLRFKPSPPLPAGWVRDFVLVGDGWEKDGDFNTTFSRTVLPLPSHDNPRYATPPTDLWHDPVYRRWPADWQNYHTRYVTAAPLRNALRIGERQ